MVFFIFILFIFLFSGGQCEDNLSQLRERSPPIGLWDIHSDEFYQFVQNGPRNYSIIIYFTSETDAVACEVCLVVRNEFEILAQYYQNQTVPKRREIFFFVVEWTRNKDIISNYNKKLKEIPMMILLPPTAKTGPQFKWPDVNKYPFNNSPLTALNLANYFNKMLPGHKIPLPEPDLEKFLSLILIVFAITLVINFYPYRNQKNFWMWVCFFIIWFSLSGNFWNLNRGPPLTFENRIIYPQQRQQTLLESIIAGSLLMILCGVFTTFDSEVIPQCKTRRTKTNFL